PKAHHFRLCQGEDSISTPLIPLNGYDYTLCVRRIHLDGILWETAAGTPGVTAIDRTTATSIHKQGGRLSGVSLSGPGFDSNVSCDLVIGADGRESLVAREAGAIEDDIVPPGLFWYYGYFADATLPGPPEFTQSAADTDMVGTMPTNDGLLMVIYGAHVEGFDAFRRDHRANFLAGINGHPWIARMIAGARLATPVYGISGIRGYYRTAHGPGWALIGDALHQKDPVVARGISDALLEAEWLTLALTSGVDSDHLDAYELTVRDRTRSNALNARMQARPDLYMTDEQGATLAGELTTSEGLAGFVLLEYSDTLTFDAYFAAPQSLTPFSIVRE
ncbi:MAG TPA: hypothetical protein VEX37_10585, partial [Thermomicrobiales bacterium]|nr:hypothetical protein [Thermomicrobiales bacterium]